MSCETRFAHNEGLTGITLTSDGKHILTCGSDGDVRVWDGCDDEDPLVFSAQDSARGLVCHESNIYVGTENNTVELYKLPKGTADGIKAKFTAEVNHLDVTKTGDILVAGSGDMTVQVITFGESSLPKKIDSHKGPILSVAIDPNSEFFVSTSCDGSICIWSIDHLSLCKKWDNAFPLSNDISASSTLCRIAWSPDGEFLAVPFKGCVKYFARYNWEESNKFTYEKADVVFSVLCFSSCGIYLAAGGNNGTLVVWNTDTNECTFVSNDSRDHITGIVFSKDNQQLYFVDIKGRMICYKEIHQQKLTPPSEDSELLKETENSDEEKDAFDDGNDALFNDDVEPDENEFSISRIKAENGFIDDQYVGITKSMKGKAKVDDDDDARSVSSIGSYKPKAAPVIQQVINPFTDPQPPFQPSSTPVHLVERFMVWNNVGILRSYPYEEEEQIDIEFHDSNHHHVVHLRNQYNYTMATLSLDACVLACKMSKDFSSKLYCYNITAWDSSKEWSIDMPKGEEITGLAIGNGWIVAVTTLNRLRVFSLGGLQKGIYDMAGTVIAISGHEDLLFVAFHNGIGLQGSQCISYSIFKIKECKMISLISSPLPISPNSTLTWMGFTDEGTPVFSDSKHYLRLLSGHVWTPYCYMGETLVGSNDCYWVVGVSETSQNIRAVKCKGTKYPPTLPRPTLLLLDAKIPLCEMNTEKSQFEDLLIKAFMLNSISKKISKKGFDIDELKETSEKQIRETLMKLFVLSCKTDRDFRASECASLMPSAHAVQIAMKYANKIRKMGLTQRLTNIGRQKMEENDSDKEEDDDDFETIRRLVSVTYGTPSNNTSNMNDMSSLQESFGIHSSSVRDLNPTTPDIGANPLLQRQKEEIRAILTPGRRNPFKKTNEDSDTPRPSAVQNESQDGKGLNFIEAWNKPMEKSAALDFNPKHPKSRTATKKAAEKGKETTSKNQDKTKEKGKQPTLFQMKGKKDKNADNPSSPLTSLNEDSNSNFVTLDEDVPSPSENAENSMVLEQKEDNSNEGKPRKTGYLLWMDLNKSTLEAENPGLSSMELCKLGVKAFRELPKEEQQKYKNPDFNGDKKRKRESDDEDEDASAVKDRRSKISSKLALFAKNTRD